MASIARSEVRKYGGSSNIKALVADVKGLVTLPDIYYRLESLIEDKTSTTHSFADVLGCDSDLCARLLGVANSAFYSFPSSIESIEKAVHIIGTRQIRELVLCTSVITSFNTMPLGVVDMKLFWKHSIAVGVFAKIIGKHCSLPQAERFYVSGLLHDIGRLVFFLKMPGLMADLFMQSEAKDVCLFQLEEEALGYDHAQVGGVLLQNWHVPQSLYEPVIFHHTPEQSFDFSHVTAAVHLSDVWVTIQQYGSSGERFTLGLNAYAMELLGLNEDNMNNLWLSAEQEIEQVSRQFLRQ